MFCLCLPCKFLFLELHFCTFLPYFCFLDTQHTVKTWWNYYFVCLHMLHEIKSVWDTHIGIYFSFLATGMLSPCVLVWKQEKQTVANLSRKKFFVRISSYSKNPQKTWGQSLENYQEKGKLGNVKFDKRIYHRNWLFWILPTVPFHWLPTSLLL